METAALGGADREIPMGTVSIQGPAQPTAHTWGRTARGRVCSLQPCLCITFACPSPSVPLQNGFLHGWFSATEAGVHTTQLQVKDLLHSSLILKPSNQPCGHQCSSMLQPSSAGSPLLQRGNSYFLSHTEAHTALVHTAMQDQLLQEEPYSQTAAVCRSHLHLGADPISSFAALGMLQKG